MKDAGQGRGMGRARRPTGQNSRDPNRDHKEGQRKEGGPGEAPREGREAEWERGTGQGRREKAEKKAQEGGKGG